MNQAGQEQAVHLAPPDEIRLLQMRSNRVRKPAACCPMASPWIFWGSGPRLESASKEEHWQCGS